MSDWYYHAPGEGRVGPLAVETLREHFASGRIGRDTLVWREGLGEWQPLERLSAELGLAPAELYAPTPAAPPPLPPPAMSTAPRLPGAAVSAPPKSGMSGCLIALIVVAVLAVPVIGILAAIAIPAYHDYTLRAKVAGAAASAEPLQQVVVEFRRQHQVCPDNDSAGLPSAESFANPSVASMTVGTFENERCGIELRLRGTGSDKIDGKALWWEYDGNAWQCSSEIDNRYLPQPCRE